MPMHSMMVDCVIVVMLISNSSFGNVFSHTRE